MEKKTMYCTIVVPYQVRIIIPNTEMWEQRHPVGNCRYATITGKYGGGEFFKLPDGTVCMCNYSYQHEYSDFMVDDTVIVLVQRLEESKRRMYGKIMSKW